MQSTGTTITWFPFWQRINGQIQRKRTNAYNMRFIRTELDRFEKMGDVIDQATFTNFFTTAIAPVVNNAGIPTTTFESAINALALAVYSYYQHERFYTIDSVKGQDQVAGIINFYMLQNSRTLVEIYRDIEQWFMFHTQTDNTRDREHDENFNSNNVLVGDRRTIEDLTENIQRVIHEVMAQVVSFTSTVNNVTTDTNTTNFWDNPQIGGTATLPPSPNFLTNTTIDTGQGTSDTDTVSNQRTDRTTDTTDTTDRTRNTTTQQNVTDTTDFTHDENFTEQIVFTEKVALGDIQNRVATLIDAYIHKHFTDLIQALDEYFLAVNIDGHYL